MSGGEQIRDFLHVKDVANYIVNLTMLQEDLGLINVCSGKPISVRQIVNDWIKINKWQIEPKLFEYKYPDYEPMEFWGSNIKLKKVLRMI